MSLQALFFDAAGTLIRPAQPVGLTYSLFAAQSGVQTEPEVVMKAFREAWKATPQPLHPPGRPSEDDDRGWWRGMVGDVFARVLGGPLPENTLGDLFDDLYLHYEQPQAWTVFDDVVPVLSDLVRDHRLFVLSNFDRRLRRILAGHDLLRFFGHVIISSEVGAAKPHARMFQAALEVADCLPEHCLHVGDDMICDIEGAQSSGMHAFRVKRPESGLAVLMQKVREGAYSGLRSTLS
ncbi:HAD-IA family hydrolase [Prosthecobacter sp.]|uniref:HAD-IA family hydrolase n=1 Tax=Prosthecobacter sp. TaxID=1965333 RepID=UPI002ABA79B8|nr:HAD-IA family hydrolase [Prosthecobacter sp.]MDZ4403888.1 HAD-IA family hydrolase [Prosthecobacter sp.]